MSYTGPSSGAGGSSIYTLPAILFLDGTYSASATNPVETEVINASGGGFVERLMVKKPASVSMSYRVYVDGVQLGAVVSVGSTGADQDLIVPELEYISNFATYTGVGVYSRPVVFLDSFIVTAQFGAGGSQTASAIVQGRLT